MMTADQFAQEYECSWVANVPGAVFGKEMQEAHEKGRIGSVPYDPSCRVDTWWILALATARPSGSRSLSAGRSTS